LSTIASRNMKKFVEQQWSVYVTWLLMRRFVPIYSVYSTLETFIQIIAPCRLWGCKNRPTLFAGRISKKVTKPRSLCPVS